MFRNCDIVDVVWKMDLIYQLLFTSSCACFFFLLLSTFFIRCFLCYFFGMKYLYSIKTRQDCRSPHVLQYSGSSTSHRMFVIGYTDTQRRQHMCWFVTISLNMHNSSINKTEAVLVFQLTEKDTQR
jgi:hypothetical protein